MIIYFFIPANRLSKIPAIRKLNIDEIIIDLEDAVKVSEINQYIEDLGALNGAQDFWIRVPIYNNHYQLDMVYYRKLIDLGFKKFVFPKLRNIIDYEELRLNFNKNHRNIILVESPLMLVEFPDLLRKYHFEIYGVGLGSHDFMNELGAKHDMNNLNFYRNLLLLYAKAYQVQAIDIASMELKNENELKHEILDGFKKGFDAKFYIHPWQIKIKDQIDFYSLEELRWAEKIMKKYNEIGDKAEFEPIIVDGEIIEKPHLNRVFAILKYFKK